MAGAELLIFPSSVSATAAPAAVEAQAVTTGSGVAEVLNAAQSTVEHVVQLLLPEMWVEQQLYEVPSEV